MGENQELYHHGVKGQKWGVRRYTNDDGTLTPLGKEHYERNKNDRKKLYAVSAKDTDRHMSDRIRLDGKRSTPEQQVKISEDMYRSKPEKWNEMAEYAYIGDAVSRSMRRASERAINRAAKNSNMTPEQYKRAAYYNYAHAEDMMAEILAEHGNEIVARKR